MYNKRASKYVVICIVLLFFLVSFYRVQAATYTLTRGDKIWFSNSGYIVKHFFGDVPVYCLQWSLSTIDNSTYKVYEDEAITDRKRFIAGKIISNIESDSSLSDDDKHLYITEALNCLFNLRGSKCFSSVSKYIEEATSYVDEVETLCTGTNVNGCFNSDNFKITVDGGSSMNQLSGNNFISNKITISGMLSSYGGENTVYKISVNGTNVSICENAAGTKCSSNSSVTLNNPTSDYSFYIKITDAKALDKVKVSATGSNSATYPYATAYMYTSNYQILMMNGETTVERGVSRNTTLQVPDTDNYTITATKIDEYGNDLEGASYEIYRANKDSGKKIASLVENINGSAVASYIEEIYKTSDEWTKYKYCFVEKSAPDGYIYGDNEKKPLCVVPSSNNSSVCYNSSGEKIDSEYCVAHEYSCANDKNGNVVTAIGGMCTYTTTPTQDQNNTTEPICLGSGYVYDATTKQCVSDSENSSGSPTVNTVETDDTSKTKENESVEADRKEAPLPTCDTANGYVYNSEITMCVKQTCESGYEYVASTSSCVKSVNASCIRTSDKTSVNSNFCSSDSTGFTLVNYGSNNIDFVKINRKNYISISKTDISGEKELVGARMKICSSKPDSSLSCEVASVVEDGQCSSDTLENGTCANNSNNTKNIKMEWISDINAKYWRGLEAEKTYYLVETVAPLGYEISSYISFVINQDGTVIVGDKTVSDNKIIVKNDLTEISISKVDMATSKELPGAELKVCLAGKNEKGEYQMSVDQGGNCSVATLEDGTPLSWTSTEEPMEIYGLAAGAYYLVETITPDGYDTAENILFILNEDGTVTDENGILVSDNKIIMKDKPIVNVPTGDIVIAIVIVLGVIGLGVGAYYYFKIYKKQNKVKSS